MSGSPPTVPELRPQICLFPASRRDSARRTLQEPLSRERVADAMDRQPIHCARPQAASWATLLAWCGQMLLAQALALLRARRLIASGTRVDNRSSRFISCGVLSTAAVRRRQALARSPPQPPRIDDYLSPQCSAVDSLEDVVIDEQ